MRYGGDWLDHPSHFAELHADLGFFAHLSAYDYWDIETASPIEDLIREHRFVAPDSLPVPDPLDLMAAAKLRLMTGLTDSALKEALQDVRDLARLLLTTENSQLVAAGLSILQEEHYAYWYFVSHKLMKREEWSPISGSLLKKARRAFEATRGYLHIWTPPEILKQVFFQKELPVGICSALNEAVPVEMSLKRYLHPHLPFERDYRAGFESLQEIIAKSNSQCRLLYLGDLLKNDNFPARLPETAILSDAPYWRKLFALRASLANFSNFDAYDRLSVVSHQTNVEPAPTPAPDERGD